jgi:methylase of polypeptide subunit release factors
MNDPYSESAEYLDIMSTDAWTTLGPIVTEALRGSNTAGEPVLDIGAGSGIGTLAIAKALPDNEIVAVEPSHPTP